MKECPPDENGVWDHIKIYNKYADYHDLPYFTDKDETIENLVIKNMKFPPHHPKSDPGSLTFKNILFENCEIDMTCWCGVKVRSSKFTDCTLIINEGGRGLRLPRTELVDCKIIVHARMNVIPSLLSKILNDIETLKGSYTRESQIRSVLSKVLDDIETLKVKDCTLTLEL